MREGLDPFPLLVISIEENRILREQIGKRRMRFTFRTMSFVYCSSSTAGTSVRSTHTGAGCLDRVVRVVSRRGRVSLDIPFHRSAYIT
jgi:hypothetical protein